eukprot:433731-Hanusia_phi.AAC.1
MSVQPELLPTCLVPRHYDLDLDLDLKHFVFAGRVVRLAAADVKEETDVVTMHALDITITSVQVTSSSDGSGAPFLLRPWSSPTPRAPRSASGSSRLTPRVSHSAPQPAAHLARARESKHCLLLACVCRWQRRPAAVFLLLV